MQASHVRSRTSEQLTLDDMYREISGYLRLLKDRCRSGLFSPSLFHEVAERLAALPLGTDEYGRFRCHLRNAWRYQSSGELGAARYELVLMEGMCR